MRLKISSANKAAILSRGRWVKVMAAWWNASLTSFFYVICSRQCPNGDGIYTLLYALYKYSTSITNQPTNLVLTMLSGCPDDFVQYKTRCYKVGPASSKRADAVTFCSGLDAHLPRPPDQETNWFVSALATRYVCRDRFDIKFEIAMLNHRMNSPK